MEILFAAILGVIQGLTEFLPISSSAHLILIPWFFGWKPEGIAFDVSLHIGTAVAVISFFWKDWVNLIYELLIGLKERNPFGNPSRKLMWLLIVGTIPAMIIGLALEDTIETILRSPLITVFTLVGLGALLWFAERKSRQDRSLEMLSWPDSLWIGCSQALALVPGVSRSGITITTAMLRNTTRTAAARFSFLLSTPIIAGAGLLEGWRLFRASTQPGSGAEAIPWPLFCVGTLAAAVTGFFCIKFFLRYLQTKTLMPFVIYRFALAAVVLIYYLRVS